MHDFDFKGAAEMPYNPRDYGLPIWRDEDHLPPQETVTAEKVEKAEAKPGVIQSAMTWALDTAEDNSHGYSQANRWGPDYDCSSFAIEAYQQAGLLLKEHGANYTGDMYAAFRSCGFEDITSSIDLSTGAGLRYGDVLHSHNSGKQHAALYAGHGQIVHARSSEGNSLQGDQSGNEIRVQPYYGPWDHVLRYTKEAPVPEPNTPIIRRKILKKGMSGEDVRELQEKLVRLGYDTGGTDGQYGTKTFVAVAKFQEAHNITPVDGEAGPVTRAVIDSLLDELPAAHEPAPETWDTLAALAAYLQTNEFLQGFNKYIERSASK
ncbi:MAG: peptidoglycan-binding protein [Bacteroidales bacterium]|nr:peptidoglycan-binding protein [Bacteroidales bacterium]